MKQTAKQRIERAVVSTGVFNDVTGPLAIKFVMAERARLKRRIKELEAVKRVTQREFVTAPLTARVLHVTVADDAGQVVLSLAVPNVRNTGSGRWHAPTPEAELVTGAGNLYALELHFIQREEGACQ